MFYLLERSPGGNFIAFCLHSPTPLFFPPLIQTLWAISAGSRGRSRTRVSLQNLAAKQLSDSWSWLTWPHSAGTLILFLGFRVGDRLGLFGVEVTESGHLSSIIHLRKISGWDKGGRSSLVHLEELWSCGDFPSSGSLRRFTPGAKKKRCPKKELSISLLAKLSSVVSHPSLREEVARSSKKVDCKEPPWPETRDRPVHRKFTSCLLVC